MKKFRDFPDDIKIYEIYKSFNLEFGLDNNFYFLFNGENLQINAQKEGSFLFNKRISYYDANSMVIETKYGKIVTATIIDNKQNKYLIPIGLLNSFKKLIERAQNTAIKKLKKIIIGNIEKNVSDTRSLCSLGIKNDFTCNVEYEN